MRGPLTIVLGCGGSAWLRRPEFTFTTAVEIGLSLISHAYGRAADWFGKGTGEEQSKRLLFFNARVDLDIKKSDFLKYRD